MGSGWAPPSPRPPASAWSLARRDWIRLGRDVVGQRTEVTVARNRFGPPGRSAELRILYAEGGSRDACLLHDDLLGKAPPGPRPAQAGRPIALHASTSPPSLIVQEGPLSLDPHATAPPPLAPPAAPARPRAPRADGHLRLVAGRPDRPRRTAVDRRDGRRRGSQRSGARRPAGDPARERTPARARGDLPRPRP